jgi:hypothetical protein
MKKILSILVSFVCMFCFCVGFASCDKNNESKKYDVSIKIKNNFNSQWIFTPDVSELTYEFEYTGEKMYFYLDSYNLPKHPRWSEKWFAPDFEGANVFSTYYHKEGQRYNEEDPTYICDKGEYAFCVIAGATSDLWNFRSVYLRIKVI